MGALMTISITREALARMFPRAGKDWLDAFEKVGPELLAHYKVSRLSWVHRCGQIAAETNGLALLPMRESLRYKTKSRLIEVYRKRLGICIEKRQPVFGKVYTSISALADRLLQIEGGDPAENDLRARMLADIVYGGREGTPWMCGSLYLGRGPTQCTHLNNYKAAQEEVARQPGGAAFDLIGNPDQLATNAELGWRVAFAEWHLKNLDRWALADDCDTLSDVLNTGNAKDNVKPHGLPRRRSETARAKAIWPADLESVASATETGVAAASMLKAGDSGPEVKRLQARLSELSYHVGDIEGEFGPLTERAVVAFQHSHSLKVDGMVGPRTWEVLAQSAPPDLGPRETVTITDLADKGSRTAATVVKAKKVIGGLFGGNAVLAADDQLGLGIADAAIAQGEKVKSLVTRGADLTAGLPMPSTRLVVSIVLAIALAVGWQWFNKIGVFRVSDARSGKHIGGKND